ncbi:MAG: sigma-70 family RNA polymerase sigma factor [Gemmatimonadota bacterium]
MSTNTGHRRATQRNTERAPGASRGGKGDLHAHALVRCLVKAQDGGREAESSLERLLTELYQPIKRFAVARLGRFADSEEIAADVAQETLFHLARSYRQCTATTVGQLMQWALVSARRVLIDMLRSPGSGLAARAISTELSRVIVSETFQESIGGREEFSTAREEMLRLAVETYDQMPEPAAALLWWRLVAGQDWTEIARIFGTTRSGAKRRFQRAQNTLRRQFAVKIETLPERQRDEIAVSFRRSSREA